MVRSHVALARAVFGGSGDVGGGGVGVVGAGETARELDERLMPGEVAFVTGPSGAGKTTIVRELAKRLRARVHPAVWVEPERLPDGAVIDCVGGSFESALNVLAMCGLSDGPVLTLRPRELSTGQRWRLALAVALSKARRRGGGAHPVTLLIDEFGSNLDRVAAMCLCRTVRRFVSGRNMRAVCAGHDDSLMESLGPAVLVVQGFRAKADVVGGLKGGREVEGGVHGSRVAI